MKKYKKNGKIGGNSLTMVRRYFPNVMRVEDALKPEIVEVTIADNNKAQIKSQSAGFMAIACKRFFEADGVIIGLTTSWIVRGKVAIRYRNSGTVSREITSFDRKAGFDVGFYLLTPVSESSRLGTYRAHDPVRRAKGGAAKRPFRHYTRNVRTTLGHFPTPEVA
jgi:hypothetical protein